MIMTTSIGLDVFVAFYINAQHGLLLQPGSRDSRGELCSCLELARRGLPRAGAGMRFQ
ncbi:MAG TPA: hypothetical protein VJN19_10165 [Propionibacteriaceae bacterium]|nr:hypothetical protein [Propionibacteriaceae bacterium]